MKNFHWGVISGVGNKSIRFSNLNASGCFYGIRSVGDSIIISGCEATRNDTGISYGGLNALIDKNMAVYNTTCGFNLPCYGVIINNVASYNGTGFILAGNDKQLIDRNSAAGNTINWSGLIGCTTGVNTP